MSAWRSSLREVVSRENCRSMGAGEVQNRPSDRSRTWVRIYSKNICAEQRNGVHSKIFRCATLCSRFPEKRVGERLATLVSVKSYKERRRAEKERGEKRKRDKMHTHDVAVNRRGKRNPFSLCPCSGSKLYVLRLLVVSISPPRGAVADCNVTSCPFPALFLPDEACARALASLFGKHHQTSVNARLPFGWCVIRERARKKRAIYTEPVAR